MADGQASWPALLQLASSGLPIGGFSYSSGLEAAIAAGLVHDLTSAQRWISAQLDPLWSCGEARGWPRLYAAWAAGDLTELIRGNQLLLAMRDSAELKQESQQMGRSLALWLLKLDGAAELDDRRRHWLELELTPLAHTTAHAAAAWALGLSPAQGLQALGWSMLEAQVSAAVRLVPLGQSQGQQLLRTLGERLPAAINQALSSQSARPQNLAPMLSVLSAHHETQYSRLFRS